MYLFIYIMWRRRNIVHASAAKVGSIRTLGNCDVSLTYAILRNLKFKNILLRCYGNKAAGRGYEGSWTGGGKGEGRDNERSDGELSSTGLVLFHYTGPLSKNEAGKPLLQAALLWAHTSENRGYSVIMWQQHMIKFQSTQTKTNAKRACW